MVRLFRAALSAPLTSGRCAGTRHTPQRWPKIRNTNNTTPVTLVQRPGRRRRRATRTRRRTARRRRPRRIMRGRITAREPLGRRRGLGRRFEPVGAKKRTGPFRSTSSRLLCSLLFSLSSFLTFPLLFALFADSELLRTTHNRRPTRRLRQNTRLFRWTPRMRLGKRARVVLQKLLLRVAVILQHLGPQTVRFPVPSSRGSRQRFLSATASQPQYLAIQPRTVTQTQNGVGTNTPKQKANSLSGSGASGGSGQDTFSPGLR